MRVSLKRTGCKLEKEEEGEGRTKRSHKGRGEYR